MKDCKGIKSRNSVHIMVKVLCLHGLGQTGELFEHQLNKLCVALSSIAEFSFVDAPYPLPQELQEDNAVVTYSWCERSGFQEYGEADDSYDAGDAVVRRHMCSEGARCDVILGFSQGGLAAARYVMLRELRGGDPYGPLPKGLILAATPDPRRAFPKLTAAFQAAVDHSHDTNGFLGPLPSLHIVGRKDRVVDPCESQSFADACQPRADIIWHEHAHSVPSLQSVIASVRSFLERVVQNGPHNANGVGVPATAFEEELEMVSCVYGEDAVQRGERTTVLLPLLLNCTDEELEGSPLATLRLRVILSGNCPASLPKLDVVGGPSNRHISYEQWKAKLVADTTAFIQEGIEAGGAVLLPAMMFASEQAACSLEFLISVFAVGERVPGGACDASGVQKKRQKVDELFWERDDNEEVRKGHILEAQRRAREVLALDCTASQPCRDYSCQRGGCVSGAGAGSLEITIGLIGKPSAGKSTFYNAVTDPESESQAARVATFPFTTIEPNVGRGFGPLFCPCSKSQLGLASEPQCAAIYGHINVAGIRHRRHPILIKDIAGLVQGAYRGRGKGNRFLNDLCDANVLVHVVDGAGATHADGSSCIPGTGSTCDDIMWVRGELHSWIYDNIRAQWGSIIRKPLKIRTMFTGYRSSPSFVDAVLQRLGIDSEKKLLHCLPEWGEAELHLLVAVFIHLRFPIVVALNKADVQPAADEVFCALRERFPDETFVRMSAKMENHLLSLRRKGVVCYVSGDNKYEENVVALADAQKPRSAEIEKALKELRNFFGSACPGTTTGVQSVLATALSKCACRLVYPVSTIQRSLTSFPYCFSFKGGTCAGEVFDTLLRFNLLDGKLVRFEAVDVSHFVQGGDVSVLKRDTILPGRHVIVRVLSNKRQLIDEREEDSHASVANGEL